MQSDTQVYQSVAQRSFSSQQNQHKHNAGTKVESACAWPDLAILPLQVYLISTPCFFVFFFKNDLESYPIRPAQHFYLFTHLQKQRHHDHAFFSLVLTVHIRTYVKSAHSRGTDDGRRAHPIRTSPCMNHRKRKSSPSPPAVPRTGRQASKGWHEAAHLQLGRLRLGQSRSEFGLGTLQEL